MSKPSLYPIIREKTVSNPVINVYVDALTTLACSRASSIFSRNVFTVISSLSPTATKRDAFASKGTSNASISEWDRLTASTVINQVVDTYSSKLRNRRWTEQERGTTYENMCLNGIWCSTFGYISLIWTQSHNHLSMVILGWRHNKHNRMILHSIYLNIMAHSMCQNNSNWT